MVVTPIKYIVAFHYYHNEGANRKAKRNKGDLAAGYKLIMVFKNEKDQRQ